MHTKWRRMRLICVCLGEFYQSATISVSREREIDCQRVRTAITLSYVATRTIFCLCDLSIALFYHVMVIANWILGSAVRKTSLKYLIFAVGKYIQLF